MDCTLRFISSVTLAISSMAVAICSLRIVISETCESRAVSLSPDKCALSTQDTESLLPCSIVSTALRVLV